MKYILVRTPGVEEHINEIIDKFEDSIDYNLTEFEYPVDKRFLKIRTKDEKFTDLLEELLVNYSAQYGVPFIYEIWDDVEPIFVQIVNGYVEKTYLLALLDPEWVWKIN